jgi:putative transposase
LLDENFRKAKSWMISWIQTAQEGRRIFEGALLSEGIMDLPEDQRHEIVKNRDRRMRLKLPKRIFDAHQMHRMTSRPRTINDNPFLKFTFFTIKSTPEYPAGFLDCDDAAQYFDRFFSWYNTKHYHCRNSYLTADLWHRGLRNKIVSSRGAGLINH